MGGEWGADVLVVGGGLGGVAAALSVARMGFTAHVVEEAEWIGGQLTAQAVAAPDEHPWIESFGATASYAALRRAIRRHYAQHYPLRPEPDGEPLNPGGGTASRLCHEPRAALAALHALLAPHLAAGRVVLHTGWRPVAADADGDRVRAVQFRHADGRRRTGTAPLVVEASETGELLPLAAVEHVTGAEAAADTGEPHAAARADPLDTQAFTWCFVLEYRPGEDHTVPRPAGYERFRADGLLSWTQPHPRTGEPRTYGLFPDGGPAGAAAFPLWTYRRLLDRSRFAPGAFASDLSLVNWPQNDCTYGSLLDPDPAAAERAREAGRQLSWALLHWLQTEAPRPDGGAGWPGLRLRPDAVGTEDGLAMRPYVREARRILPVFRVLEQHLAAELRPEGRAAPFPDSVGVGLYRIDLHPSAAGRGYIDLACCPFQIPLGCLLPRRVRNLVAGGKAAGTTHITNGAFRVHPVEWNVGEAAGALAAFCRARGTEPHAVRARPALLAEFQGALDRLGVPLAWPQPGPV